MLSTAGLQPPAGSLSVSDRSARAPLGETDEELRLRDRSDHESKWPSNARFLPSSHPFVHTSATELSVMWRAGGVGVEDGWGTGRRVSAPTGPAGPSRPDPDSLCRKRIDGAGDQHEPGQEQLVLSPGHSGGHERTLEPAVPARVTRDVEPPTQELPGRESHDPTGPRPTPASPAPELPPVCGKRAGEAECRVRGQGYQIFFSFPLLGFLFFLYC